MGTATDTNSISTASIALGDIDGDGVLDIVEGNESHKSRYYLNDGDSDPFTPITTGVAVSADLPDSRSLALRDMDRDGDLDVVVAVRSKPGLLERVG